MQPRVALIIGAVAAAVIGLALLLAPATMLKGFGLQTPDEGIILSRDLGLTLVAVAVLNWLARDATGTALRAILIGNLIIQVLEIVVNGYEIAVGMLPTKAAPGLMIHVVLGAIFILALRKVEARVPAERVS